ncbi:hypothetical protein UC8_50140 [Roseimaritima ulvae]|uniref:Uncharacterized protein n=1 Tax=Roseimaritima ulvae TaxID=980254 RepID=A0A5B9R867_9BACT|nr:hypothetical protein UC8_50140 [Roseimaritima ulvae]
MKDVGSRRPFSVDAALGWGPHVVRRQRGRKIATQRKNLCPLKKVARHACRGSVLADAQFVKQKRVSVDGLFDLMTERVAAAVAGIGTGSQQNGFV